MIEYYIYPGGTETVHGIGVMALDEVEDYEKYKATIYSVTFHMKPEYQAE